VNPKSNVPDLSLSDLELSDVDVHGLTKEDAMGIPELGASFGTFGCCTYGQSFCTA
jgi:Thiopeptide-type bacteriocin precursor